MTCRYDREDNSFRFLVNIQFVTAMGPPGGGRNPVTPRYMRHFNVLAILDFEDTSLAVVFSIIFDWWARKSKLPHDVRIHSIPFSSFPGASISVIGGVMVLHLNSLKMATSWIASGPPWPCHVSHFQLAWEFQHVWVENYDYPYRISKFVSSNECHDSLDY